MYAIEFQVDEKICAAPLLQICRIGIAWLSEEMPHEKPSKNSGKADAAPHVPERLPHFTCS
jgi:hypothetical protein